MFWVYMHHKVGIQRITLLPQELSTYSPLTRHIYLKFQHGENLTIDYKIQEMLFYS